MHYGVSVPDGIHPIGQNLNEMMTPGQVRDLIAYINEHRDGSAPFDIIQAGITSGKDLAQDAGIVAEFAAVGVTWWMEAINPERWGDWGNWPLEAMRQRILDGPPKV